MSKRLPPQAGEWIDRQHALEFSFEGERIAAYQGDVISSALVANGFRVLARSFKYHRPRGVLSLANHDANVLLTDGQRTHIRGDVEAPQIGRHYHAVNTIGGVKRDALQALSLFSPVLPVGFYYKAFYKPRALFKPWERVIRRAAGLGTIDRTAPAQRQHRIHRYCDVLIIGAGSSGMAAASTLLDSGLDVVIADENARFGGSFSYLHIDADSQSLFNNTLDAINASDTITVLPGHFAAGFYSAHLVPQVGATGTPYCQPPPDSIPTGAPEQPAVL